MVCYGMAAWSAMVWQHGLLWYGSMVCYGMAAWSSMIQVCVRLTTSAQNHGMISCFCAHILSLFDRGYVHILLHFLAVHVITFALVAHFRAAV
jgi:hypothetical protein